MCFLLGGAVWLNDVIIIVRLIAGLMLGQRRRRWTNIEPAMSDPEMFTALVFHHHFSCIICTPDN